MTTHDERIAAAEPKVEPWMRKVAHEIWCGEWQDFGQVDGSAALAEIIARHAPQPVRGAAKLADRIARIADAAERHALHAITEELRTVAAAVAALPTVDVAAIEAVLSEMFASIGYRSEWVPRLRAALKGKV